MPVNKYGGLSTDTTLGGASPSNEVVSSQKALKEYIDTGLSGKQETLTAGTGIDITSNTISVTSPTIVNTATSTGAFSISGSDTAAYSYVLGSSGSISYSSYGTTIGIYAQIGYNGSWAIQLGYGINDEGPSTFCVGLGPGLNYKMLGSDGIIPDTRISSNIARTSAIPTVNNATLTITQGGTTKGTFTANASSDVTIDLDSGGSSIDIDNKSITQNSSDELQTVGVIDQNATTTAIKTWTGTLAQYNSLVSGGTVDSNTLYNITDDSDSNLGLLETIYPVGSIYIGTMGTCPLASLFGTWTKVSEGRVLQGSDSNHTAGSTIAAGLPNITGNFNLINHNPDYHNYSGAFSKASVSGMPISGLSSGALWNEGWGTVTEYFNASLSDSIYGNSSTVQPPAFVVNIWQRTA